MFKEHPLLTLTLICIMMFFLSCAAKGNRIIHKNTGIWLILTQNISVLIQASCLSDLSTDLSFRFLCQDISEHCLVWHITSSVQPLILMSADLPIRLWLNNTTCLMQKETVTICCVCGFHFKRKTKKKHQTLTLTGWISRPTLNYIKE